MRSRQGVLGRRRVSRGLLGVMTVGAVLTAGTPAALADDPTPESANDTAAAVNQAVAAADPSSADVAAGSSSSDRVVVTTTPDQDAAAQVGSPSSVRVVVPTDPDAGVVISAVDATGRRQTMTVGVPDSSAVDDASVADDGTVVYASADEASATSNAVQPLEDGSVRMTVVINDSSASPTYRFPLELPSDVHPQLTDDGGVDLLSHDIPSEDTVRDVVYGHVDPAWAVDANGAPVPSHYAIAADGALVQYVDFDSSTAFPVLADPHWTWGWISGTVYFNKYETLGVAGSFISIIPSVMTAPPPFNVAGLWYSANVIGYAISARALGKCLKVQYGFTWSWKGASPGVTPGHYTGGWCR